jgi:hypothetical protein
MYIGFLVIFAIFAVPVGAYIWYVAVHKPSVGRARQVQHWQPLATRLGGRFVASPGGARFHSIVVPFGATEVRCIVFDRAAHDPQLSQRNYEVGGWRTFVQADVPQRRGVPLAIIPRARSAKAGVPTHPAVDAHHVVVPELQTPPHVIAHRVGPELAQALAAIGPRYDYVQAGPQFVNLEIPGICQDPAVLEAAIRVVGALAQPAA